MGTTLGCADLTQARSGCSGSAQVKAAVAHVQTKTEPAKGKINPEFMGISTISRQNESSLGAIKLANGLVEVIPRRTHITHHQKILYNLL